PDGDVPATGGPIDPPCEGADDPSSCSASQICMWSECRDAAGWVPPIPADRDATAAYLAFRLKLLFGPFLQRADDLPSAEAALDQMLHAGDRWAYWNGFLLALRRRHDGHTTT